MVAKELPEYHVAVVQLKPVLCGFPGKLIGIDGRDGSGKTTLGRYLAWQFNCTLIETDNFIIGDGSSYNFAEIARIVKSRLSIPRPVFVEGICLCDLLRKCLLQADFLIHIRSAEFDGSDSLSDRLKKYETDFLPHQIADLSLRLNTE